MTSQNQQLATELGAKLEGLSLDERLVLIAARFPKAVFTTSLGLEDQVITHSIATGQSAIRIATLQTGRLFPETIELLAQTQSRYEFEIESYEPDPQAVNAYIKRYQLDGFYDSVKARHACCHIRKMIPLSRALAPADAWVTGLRRGQSNNRSAVAFAEWSDENQLMKFNPLADWSLPDLQSAIAIHDIPVNPLHALGFPSIGCAPCTRAIQPGEPERAGRWWWEQDQQRECGLHVPEEQTEAAVQSVGSSEDEVPNHV